MKREEIKNVRRIRFNDFSDYDSEKCNNGGCYGFWTDYNRLENGKWEISYGTTADMDFCPCCGSFNDHYVGDDCRYDSEYDCGEFGIVTEDELLKIIDEFEENEGEYIEFK